MIKLEFRIKIAILFSLLVILGQDLKKKELFSPFFENEIYKILILFKNPKKLL